MGFSQIVHPSPSGALCVLAVHTIRKSDVNGIDFAATEASIVFLVGVKTTHVILLAKFLEFDRIIRYKGRQLRVLACIRKCRQDGDLRNVSLSNDRIPDLSLASLFFH